MKNIKSLIEYPKSGILSKHLVNTLAMDVTLFCEAKGSEMSEHTSSREAFIYFLEGSGIFYLRKKPIKIFPGLSIHMKKNMPHSLKIKKNTAFLLILTGEKSK